MLFAADHVYWTESIADIAANHAGRRKEDQSASIWLLGTASKRTRQELSKLGFTLHEGVAAEMVASADE